MTANLPTLNPSETKFVQIGLPQQSSTISNPSLSLFSNRRLYLVLVLPLAVSVSFSSPFPSKCISHNPASVAVTVAIIFAISGALDALLTSKITSIIAASGFSTVAPTTATAYTFPTPPN